MSAIRALVFGVLALAGMSFVAGLAGSPVVAGRVSDGVYQTAETRFAEPLPASDGDDLSGQPPGEAPEPSPID